MCIEAYFAGLLDGEGYVGIRTVRHSKSPDYISYSPQINITNCSLPVLEEAQRKWGGWISYDKSRAMPVFKWGPTAGRASEFLTDVYSHLRIKQAQVMLVFQLQERMTSYGKHKLTEDEISARRNLQQQIKNLNQRRYFGETAEEKFLKERAKRLAVGGGCLSCGCGDLYDLHGNPLNLSYTRLALTASRLGITPLAVAENILGTVLGEITKSDPRNEGDLVIFKLARLNKNGIPTPKRRGPYTTTRPTDPTGSAAAYRAEARRKRKAQRQARSNDTQSETDLSEMREDS